MRVAFVLQDLQLSGGVGVVVEHARHLRADHGIDAQLVLAQEELHPRWPFRGLDEVPVLTYEEALGEEWDIGVATWWQTTAVLFHLQCERYAYFIQALEDSLFRPGDPERVTAALTTSLPVRFITEAQWIVEMLAALQPGNDAHYVRNGIAKDVFTPPGAVPDLGGGPLRVVIEGARDVPLKGIDQALEAAGLMTEPAHVTWVAPHGTTDAPVAVDRVLSRLTHREMAELFSDSHVLLKLSRAEGMYGPPLEAFHCGATVVTTAVTGHDEYVLHAENGLVVGWDDVHGTARALDLLARDRELLGRLRAGALDTARAWPDWSDCGTAMAAALRQIVSDPPPPLRAAGQRLASEFGTVTAELQVRDRALEVAWASERELRSEKAWIWAMSARRRYHRVRTVARRIKPGRST